MKKLLASLLMAFWVFAIGYTLCVGIKYIALEPSLGGIGIIGFLVFSGSGLQVIFPYCLEAFVKNSDSETEDKR